MPHALSFLGVMLTAVVAARADGPPTLDFRDGDRVVLIGGTFVEREPSYGYLEAAWTAAYPDREVTFRNLGWSGDTVTGISRARFGPPEEGFQHLKEHVLALKPTVLIVCYGANEAFEGEAGLLEFRKNLNRLLDTLAASKARTVLVSPIRNQSLGPPLPDPTAHNKAMALYRDVLREAARERGLGFVDLLATGFPPDPGESQPLLHTDDGVTLNAFGYWELPQYFGPASEPPCRISIGVGGDDTLCVGGRVSKLEAGPRGVRFELLRSRLPRNPAPLIVGEREHDLELKIRGLEAGTYALRIDGEESVRATANQWAKGVLSSEAPGRRQVEALRHAIIKKNRLYFHRWRPQNETYLFGFRKHEQGQNAREVPLFDPLVAEQEAEIARLKVPVAHTYELRPIAEDAR